MKDRILNNLNLLQAVIAIVLMLALGFFCYVVNFSLSIPLLILLLGLYLKGYKNIDTKLFLHFGFLLALIVFVTHALLTYTTISALYVPVAAVAMIVMLLYNDLQLAFVMSFASSILVGLVAGNRLDLTIVYFCGSLMGAFCVRDSRTRSELLNAAFFVGILQVLCIVLLNPSKEFLFSREFVLVYLRALFFNGFISAAVVLVTLKIFENLFGVMTNFSLLELSDFNHPLLRLMILESPGTYHHSLFVSNLSETAADAIGANSLLARVGGYYHDIGKLEKPQYFTENQIFEGNRHDKLEPSMSRLVILNHVKDGMELAKKYKLNPIISDFILQHHGTSVMHYFYQRAISEVSDGQTVDEQTFRYPGPKPQTRETAIVLLADSVEGACRSLDEPTPTRIDDTVRKVVNNKFIDGQLDECNLTLKDLDRISATFSRVLSAMYHSRIKYPEKTDGYTANRKKSTEENSNKS
ncbi:MAG: HDIG domain-containing protein [Candidatus Omnitrophica bacterium]|nr:HDIG domain-containing protein [Candidatus Omnitrophota bacterium]